MLIKKILARENNVAHLAHPWQTDVSLGVSDQISCSESFVVTKIATLEQELMTALLVLVEDSSLRGLKVTILDRAFEDEWFIVVAVVELLVSPQEPAFSELNFTSLAFEFEVCVLLDGMSLQIYLPGEFFLTFNANILVALVNSLDVSSDRVLLCCFVATFMAVEHDSKMNRLVMNTQVKL